MPSMQLLIATQAVGERLGKASMEAFGRGWLSKESSVLVWAEGD